MQSRVKYPLTPEAKEAAKKLSDIWKAGELDQLFYFNENTSYGTISETIAKSAYSGKSHEGLKRSLLMELARFGLLQIHFSGNDGWEILLLEELMRAVENDFEVSDFFLTTSAVGTIIYGNLTLDKGALFQSAAAGIGDVSVTAQTLPDEIIKLLGADADRPEVAAAIEELRQSNDTTRIEKAGKVIQELGRSLEHVANAGGALSAIAMIVRVLTGQGL